MSDPPMFSYRAFGLRIGSELELPELSVDSCDGPSDVQIHVRTLGLIEAARGHSLAFAPQRQVFSYEDIGVFVIQGVDEIVIEPAPGASASLLALPLLGPVLALLLHLRGHFVLHGSAVALGGASLGFLGDKGAGKSTLAAALLRTPNASLLTDDLLAFDGAGAILPAFPQIKLAPDALARFGQLNGVLRPPPAVDFPKRQVRLDTEAAMAPTQPRALYEIRRGPEARIETLTGAEALRTLIRYSYISRFVSRPLDDLEHKRFFVQAARIGNLARVHRLFVPDRIERLDELGDFLTQQVLP